MITKASITWNAKQVATMFGKGILKFDNIIQRSLVWKPDKKSDLIHSMIENYPIPPLYAKKVVIPKDDENPKDRSVYDFLDGKQRINAIVSYINNEYYLIGIGPVEFDPINNPGEMIDINGKKFSDLPESITDRILGYSLTIYYFDGIDLGEERTMFRKLNNGKSLSTKERNIANCADIERVSELGDHELFKTVFTKKALDSRNQLPIIMKMWMMLNEEIEDVSFESDNFNEVMQDTRMTDEEVKEIESVLDKMLEVYKVLEDQKQKERKKMVAETHLVSLVPFFEKAIEDEINEEDMADFIVKIFSERVVSEAYEQACRGGSAKTANIKVRNDEIKKVWEEVF